MEGLEVVLSPIVDYPPQASEYSIQCDRAKAGRRIMFFLYLVVMICAPSGVGMLLVPDDVRYHALALLAGYIISLVICIVTFKGFVLGVDGDTRVITKNPLNKKKPYETYEHGPNICYPCEKIYARIHLKGMLKKFILTVDAGAKTVCVAGSLWARPDLKRWSELIQSLTSMTTEMKDIVTQFISEKLSALGTEADLEKSLELVNVLLSEGFCSDPRVHDFQERFGIILGNLVINQIHLT